MGILGIVVGVVTFVWPGLTALSLLYLVAFWAIATGTFQVIAAIALRRELDGEFWMALGGVASIVFGVLLVASPGDGLITLVWLVGIWAVVFGVSSLGLAYRLHDDRRGPAQAGGGALTRTRARSYATKAVIPTSFNDKEAHTMAASEDLKKLSARARVAEDHAAAAKDQARAELEQSITNVRDSAEAEAQKLQAKTQAAGQRASDDWEDVQNSWNAHLAKARADMSPQQGRVQRGQRRGPRGWDEGDAAPTAVRTPR